MEILIYPENVPFLTTDQMIEVDRAMIEDYHIALIQMMENAGRNLAHLSRDRFWRGNPVGKNVCILAGTGGNGGGALVCARRLHNYGANVYVLITKKKEFFSPVAGHQLDILNRMCLTILTASEINELPVFDLVVDGIIGYSLKGHPRNDARKLIDWANSSGVAVLALDTPSGIDATTGTIFNPAIKATATLTLALPKEGFKATGVKEFIGELYLADISVPPELYSREPLNSMVGNLFSHNDIIRLW